MRDIATTEVSSLERLGAIVAGALGALFALVAGAAPTAFAVEDVARQVEQLTRVLLP